MALYEKTQKMTQWWLWAILLGTTGFVLGEIVVKALDRPLSWSEFLGDPQLWVSALVLILVLVFFFLLSLKTEVSAAGIHIHYFPIWKTHIPWHEVKSAKIMKYGFVGYGIRLSFRYGVVYNAKGNWGLQIVKKNGGKVLIGTQRPEELKAAVDKFL